MNSITTTRFGEVEVTEEHKILFKDGIIGFPSLREYVLIESPAMPLVLWLQSTEAPEIAFPVAEPWFFKRDYKAVMTDADKHSLGFEEGDRTKLLIILTIPQDMTKMTANMKAPVMLDVNKQTGTQLILQDKTLEVRTPAHEAFSRALSNIAVDYSVENEVVEDRWTPVNVKRPETQVEGAAQ